MPEIETEEKVTNILEHLDTLALPHPDLKTSRREVSEISKTLENKETREQRSFARTASLLKLADLAYTRAEEENAGTPGPQQAALIALMQIESGNWSPDDGSEGYSRYAKVFLAFAPVLKEELTQIGSVEGRTLTEEEVSDLLEVYNILTIAAATEGIKESEPHENDALRARREALNKMLVGATSIFENSRKLLPLTGEKDVREATDILRASVAEGMRVFGQQGVEGLSNAYENHLQVGLNAFRIKAKAIETPVSYASLCPESSTLVEKVDVLEAKKTPIEKAFPETSTRNEAGVLTFASEPDFAYSVYSTVYQALTTRKETAELAQNTQKLFLETVRNIESNLPKFLLICNTLGGNLKTTFDRFGLKDAPDSAEVYRAAIAVYTVDILENMGVSDVAGTITELDEDPTNPKTSFNVAARALSDNLQRAIDSNANDEIYLEAASAAFAHLITAMREVEADYYFSSETPTDVEDLIRLMPPVPRNLPTEFGKPLDLGMPILKAGSRAGGTNNLADAGIFRSDRYIPIPNI